MEMLFDTAFLKDFTDNLDRDTWGKFKIHGLETPFIRSKPSACY